MGDLEPVFATCGQALRPDGLFAFSVEAAEGVASYVLRDTGRYAHSADYIRKLAEAHGLRVLSMDQVGLRKEKGAWMPGYIFVLGR